MAGRRWNHATRRPPVGDVRVTRRDGTVQTMTAAAFARQAKAKAAAQAPARGATP